MVNDITTREETTMAKVVPELRDGEQQVFFRAGGEWCYLWTPKTFELGRPIPVVVHHHGYAGWIKEGSADWLEEDYKVGLLKAIMSAGGGCGIAASHACGNHFGRPDSVIANTALFDVLIESGHADPERMGLVGGGLGGPLMWNSVMGPLAGRVKAVVMMQGMISLENFLRAQPLRGQCLEDYNLPLDTPIDEAVAKVAPHDPLPRLLALPYGTPMPRTAIFHGAEDPNQIPSLQVIPLAEALKRIGADVTMGLFPGVGHAVYNMGERIEECLRSFFAAVL